MDMSIDMLLVFSSFFLFSKKKLPIVVMRDVCPSVRLSSVEIISFRGIRRGSACPKGVIFRNSNCKLQIYAI